MELQKDVLCEKEEERIHSPSINSFKSVWRGSRRGVLMLFAFSWLWNVGPHFVIFANWWISHLLLAWNFSQLAFNSISPTVSVSIYAWAYVPHVCVHKWWCWQTMTQSDRNLTVYNTNFSGEMIFRIRMA